MSRFNKVEQRRVFGRVYLDITLGEHGKWTETFTVFQSDGKWVRKIPHEEPVVQRSVTRGVRQYVDYASPKHERRIKCRVQHEMPLYGQTQQVEYRHEYSFKELDALVKSYN